MNAVRGEGTDHQDIGWYFTTLGVKTQHQPHLQQVDGNENILGQTYVPAMIGEVVERRVDVDKGCRIHQRSSIA